MPGRMASIVRATFLFSAGVLLLASCCGPDCSTAAGPAGELTAEEVIARCADALGGMEKIREIENLRIRYRMPDHGEHVMGHDIERPNRLRLINADLVFDGERACFLNGMDGDSGPEFVDPAELIDFDVDLGFYFPAFFDYPSEYAGIETIDRREFHKLTVDLPMGATMAYLIDADTYLPVKAGATFTIGDRQVSPYRDYFDYREAEGVSLPFGLTYGSRYGQIKGWIVSYELNVEFPEDHFAVPATCSADRAD